MLIISQGTVIFNARHARASVFRLGNSEVASQADWLRHLYRGLNQTQLTMILQFSIELSVVELIAKADWILRRLPLMVFQLALSGVVGHDNAFDCLAGTLAPFAKPQRQGATARLRAWCGSRLGQHGCCARSMPN